MITEKKKRGRPKGSKTVNHFVTQRKKRTDVYTPAQAKLIKYITRKDRQMTSVRFDGITKALSLLEQTEPSLCETKRNMILKAYEAQKKQYYACLNRDNTDVIVDVMSFGGEKKEVAIRNILKGYISLEGSCLAERSKVFLKVAMNVYYLQTHLEDPCFSYSKVYMDVVGEKPNGSVSKHVRKFVLLISQLAKTEELHFYKYVVYNASKENALSLKTEKENNRELQILQRDIEKEKEQLRQIAEKKQSIIDQIAQQDANLDAYIADYEPYKYIHQRRYDFEVKNQVKSNDEFKAELRAIYEDTYDYTPVNYVNSRTIVQVFCIKHQKMFKRMPQHLLCGYGCPQCNKEQGKTWQNTCMVRKTEEPLNKKWTKEKFIKESKKRHGNDVFDYTFVEYENNDTPVLLIRKSDKKEFYVTPCEHLRHDADYDGTRKTYKWKSNYDKLMSLRKLVRERMDGKYLVPDQDVDNSNIILVCPDHGPFKYSRATILTGNCMCPDCKGKSNSVGERRIEQYLEAKGIEYKPEYRIEDKQYFPQFARVDFYLPNKHVFIEFQGEQHYRDVNIGGNTQCSLAEQMERDYNMRRYCADHGIMLIEIPYQFRDDVASFLDKFFPA